MTINFTVPGEPQGKARPRFARIKDKVITRTAENTVLYENLIITEFKRQCGNTRFFDQANLKMTVSAYFSIPKSASAIRRQQMINKLILPTKRPDVDNVLKVVADALNGIAYRDDAQIVGASIYKFYGEVPRVEVSIEQI